MHQINIPQPVIDACLVRRGQFEVFETIDPARTALVVIDMQNAWVESGLSPVEIPETRSIVDNINRLAAAARKAGATVAWTKSVFDAEWTRKMYARFGPPEWLESVIETTAAGTVGHEISDRMDVGADDIVVVKTRPSAFIQGSSDLEQQLRDRGIDTIIITGTLTNACCESSARDAMALGFHCLFVSDGTATRSDEEHNATLTNLVHLVAGIMRTDEVVALLDKAAPAS